MKTRLLTLGIFTSFLFSIVLNLGGCAMGTESIAKEDAATLQQKIVNGKTTKADLQKMFGEPSERGTKNGREYWMYRLQTAGVRTFIPFVGLATGNSGTEIKDLTIDFDKSGVVTNFDLSVFKG